MPATVSLDGTIAEDTTGVIVDSAGRRSHMVANSDATIGNQIAVAALPVQPFVTDVVTRQVNRLYARGGVCHQDAQASRSSWGYTGTPAAWVAEADPTKPPSSSGIYKVANGRVVDPTGKPFRAKGVNVCFTQVWGNHQVDIGRVNLALLQRAFPGLNFVRFANWGPLCDPSDPVVTAWVKALTDAGIIVEVELHYTGDAIAGNDPTATDWFKRCVTAWKDNARVWWGTQNEPHGAAISDMMWGQYQTIRNAGATSPIALCPGNPGAEMTGMNASYFAQMTGVFFDLHYYGWIPAAGITWANLCGQTSGFRSRDGQIPIFCLEYGDATDGKHRDGNWMDVLNTVFAIPDGSAAWMVNWGSGGGDELLAAPFDGRTLTDYGKLVAANARNT